MTQLYPSTEHQTQTSCCYGSNSWTVELKSILTQILQRQVLTCVVTQRARPQQPTHINGMGSTLTKFIIKRNDEERDELISTLTFCPPGVLRLRDVHFINMTNDIQLFGSFCLSLIRVI